MKNKILSIGFFLFIFIFFVINIVMDDVDVSLAERRKLTKLPEITIQNIFNGKITNKFEDYALDQFAFRDNFRSLKAFIQFNLLGKLDYNNMFVKDNYIYKIEYPLKENKVNSFVNKINNIYNTYLQDMNVYYSIIPDKNYYLDNNYLKMNYDKLINIVNNGLINMEYIDITNCLDIDDYYYTDIHWKQENLGNVVSTLSNKMHFNYSNDYKINKYEPFYGSYYGQIGLTVKKDVITYLTNNVIENALVKDYESNLNTVYETDSLGKMDSYDVFLSGATPIIEITNSLSENTKELVIFRDSFASALAPLLIEGYYKITLIDLRYINSRDLEKYIEFNNQDILFLYNTTIINNSDMIRG